MAVGVKETLDVLVALEVAADAVVKAAADGSLGVLDVRYLMAPVKASLEAVKGRELVVAELKDLDEKELGVLVEKGAAVAEKVVGALEALEKVVK